MPMPIEMQDRVPVPHFKQRLWEELAELHEQRRGSGAEPEPRVVALDGGRHRGWRGRRSLLVGAGSIAAAALLVVTQLDVGPDGTSGQPAELELRDRVLAATRQALADSVVHSVFDYASGVDRESWFDETTGANRTLALGPDGNPIADVGRAVAPEPGERAPAFPPPPSDDVGEWVCVPGPCLPEDMSGYPVEHVRTVCYDARRYGDWDVPMGPPTSEADGIRQLLDADMLVEDGTEVVDGRELLRLRAPRDQASPGEDVYLVDPESYRPVLMRGEPYDVITEDGSLYSDPGYETSFEYLPRTAENLARLSPSVPDDFAEVSREELQQLDCG